MYCWPYQLKVWGLNSQRAAHCNGILISILVFPIKPHYMKLLLHALTQKQLSYLRICIFHFSFVPIDLPTVSLCTVFCTYSTSIGICSYSYRYGVRCTCTVHTRTVIVSYICTDCICKLTLTL